MFRAEHLKDTSAIDDKVSWLELQSFLDWLLICIRPVVIAPGETFRYYIDMADTILLSIKVPELKMQTERPFVLNISNPSLLLQSLSSYSSSHTKETREQMLGELPRWIK